MLQPGQHYMRLSLWPTMRWCTVTSVTPEDWPSKTRVTDATVSIVERAPESTENETLSHVGRSGKCIEFLSTVGREMMPCGRELLLESCLAKRRAG